LSEPEGRAGLTDKLDADVRAALGRIARVPQLACPIATEQQAAERASVGSPTALIGGVDPVPPPAGEPTGLTCRVYRRRDGRYSPTPDPADLRDGLADCCPRPLGRPGHVTRHRSVGSPFTLPDTDGSPTPLHSGDGAATVVVFTSNHCPYLATGDTDPGPGPWQAR
jgi:hypothetical protein